MALGTWDKTKPADNEYADSGALAIRDFKDAVEDRMLVMTGDSASTWCSTGLTVGTVCHVGTKSSLSGVTESFASCVFSTTESCDLLCTVSLNLNNQDATESASMGITLLLDAVSLGAVNSDLIPSGVKPGSEGVPLRSVAQGVTPGSHQLHVKLQNSGNTAITVARTTVEARPILTYSVS